MTGIRYSKIEGVAVLRDSSKIDIPEIVVEGKRSGPTLFLEATTHGQEVVNMHIIHELVHRTIDPELLKGKIIAHPLSNPLAFLMGSRNNFLDDTNMSGMLGRPDGTVTERMAYTVFETAKKADFMISMHTTYEPSIPYAIVSEGAKGKEKLVKKSIEGAKAYGVTTVTRPRGVFGDGLYDAGIPYFVVELEGYGRVIRNQIKVGVRGVTNVMKYLGMLNGRTEDQYEFVKVLKGDFVTERVKAEKSGIVKFQVDAGDKVSKNGLIAEITDIYGRKLEEIRAPKEAYLNSPYYPCSGNNYNIHNEAVYAGDYVVQIFVKK